MSELLLNEMRIADALRQLYERQTVKVIELFSFHISNTIFDCLEFVCLTYDYEDDTYISFSCKNRYSHDVSKEMKRVFGHDCEHDYHDRYTDYLVSLSLLEEAFA